MDDDFTFEYVEEDAPVTQTATEGSDVEFEYVTEPEVAVRQSDKTPDEAVDDYTNNSFADSVKSGDRPLSIGNYAMLDHMSYGEIYERASEPDEVGAWLSDAIRRNSDDNELVTKILERRNAWEGGFSITEGGRVPKGYEKTQIHDEYWQGLSKSAFSGLTMQWGDELLAMAETDNDADYEASLERWSKSTEQFRATNPAAAFIAESLGALGTMLISAPVVTTVGAPAAAAVGATRAGAAISGAVGASRLATGVKNVGGLAAAGAVENAVYGAGERDAGDKTNFDAIVNDGVTGALLGGAIGTAFKVAPKALDLVAGTSKDVLEGVFGTSITQNPSKTAKAVTNALKTVGIPKAAIAKLEMEAVGRNENPNLLELITLAAERPEQVEQFNDIVMEYIKSSGNYEIVKGLRTPLADMSKVVASEAKRQVDSLSGEGGAEVALKEISDRIKNGTISDQSKIDNQIQAITDMLTKEEQTKFFNAIKAEPDLLTDQKLLTERIQKVTESKKETGAAIDRFARAINVNTTIESGEFDQALDAFRTIRPEGMEPPKYAFEMKRLESSINSLPEIKNSPWELRIPEQYGGRSQLVMRLDNTGDDYTNAFARELAEKRPDIAERYNVTLDDDGGLSIPQSFEISSQDISVLKTLPTFKNLAERKLGVINLNPPTVTQRHVREATDGLRGSFKDEKSNITTENEERVRASLENLAKTKNDDYAQTIPLYKRLTRTVEMLGAEDELGAMRFSKFVKNTAPTKEQISDLSDTVPYARPLIAARYINSPEFSKLFYGDEAVLENTVRRMAEFAKLTDSTLNTDEVVESVLTARKDMVDINAMREIVSDKLNVGGLNQIINKLQELPNQAAALKVTGDNIKAQTNQLSQEFSERLETSKELKSMVEKSGLNSEEIKQALDSLEQLTDEAALNFTKLIDTTYEAVLIKALNGVTSEQLKTTIKPISDMLRSKEGREIFETAVASRVGRRDNISPDLINAEIAKEIDTLDTISKMANTISDLERKSDISDSDLRSASIVMEAGLKAVRTKGTTASSDIFGMITYASTEIIRLVFNRTGFASPRLNPKETEILANMLMNRADPKNIKKMNRALNAFYDKKPGNVVLSEWLKTQLGQYALLQMAIVME